MNENTIKKIGWFASIMAIAMYFSFIDQIRLNLSGHPGSVILPVIATINGVAWVAYSSLKIPKDWPIFVCNVPAVILGLITAVTAIM